MLKGGNFVMRGRNGKMSQETGFDEHTSVRRVTTEPYQCYFGTGYCRFGDWLSSHLQVIDCHYTDTLCFT
jgi:hypothetical protein